MKKDLLFSRSGNHGNRWVVARFELDQHKPFYGGSLQLEFVGTRGRTFRSDLAIDDICTSEGPCGTNQKKSLFQFESCVLLLIWYHEANGKFNC